MIFGTPETADWSFSQEVIDDVDIGTINNILVAKNSIDISDFPFSPDKNDRCSIDTDLGSGADQTSLTDSSNAVSFHDQYSDRDLLLETNIDVGTVASAANSAATFLIPRFDAEDCPPFKRPKNGTYVPFWLSACRPDPPMHFYHGIDSSNSRLEWRLFLLRVPKLICDAMNIGNFEGVQNVIDHVATATCILISPNVPRGIVGRKFVTALFTTMMETYPDGVMVVKPPKLIDGVIESTYFAVGTKLCKHPSESLICDSLSGGRKL